MRGSSAPSPTSRNPPEPASSAPGGIAVTAVINIVEGGRRSLFIRSTLPPLISDTLVTGLPGGAALQEAPSSLPPSSSTASLYAVHHSASSSHIFDFLKTVVNGTDYSCLGAPSSSLTMLQSQSRPPLNERFFNVKVCVSPHLPQLSSLTKWPLVAQPMRIQEARYEESGKEILTWLRRLDPP